MIGIANDPSYEILEERLATPLVNRPLFRTDNSELLFPAFLNALPADRRQHYNCRCCENFIREYGGLVHLNGERSSATWNFIIPEMFWDSVTAMTKIIRRSKIMGVFLSSEKVFGTPKSPKGWTHLHAFNPSVFKHPTLTASQREAELKEEYALVQRTIRRYNKEIVAAALQILSSGTVRGEEKGQAIVEWYSKLIADPTPERVWLAVATAPPGFAHLRNGMVGTLFDDLTSGRSFEEIKRAWDAKMNPVKYRRPTAAVSEGQIDAAEKMVEKLGIARSLERRFAQASELKNVIWEYVPTETREGVFSKLRDKPRPIDLDIPAQKITWTVFERDVLPGIQKLEVLIPRSGAFTGMTSAVHMDAPPILKWDDPENRNPVSHYVYINGSLASQWGLTAETWAGVNRMAWQPGYPYERRYLFLNIESMRDSRGNSSGSALFPENMKSHLKPIEKVIEKFSNKTHLVGEGNANGIMSDPEKPATLRVNGGLRYIIDRWE